MIGPRDIDSVENEATAFRPALTLLAGVGLALRLMGAVAALHLFDSAIVLHQCLIGAGIQANALLLIRGGRPNLALLLSAVDYLGIARLTTSFGTSSQLYQYALLHPFLSLGYRRLGIVIRVALGVFPPLAFVLIRASSWVPPTTGLLDPVWLRNLATLNVVIFVGLSVAFTIAAMRDLEDAAARQRRLAESRSRLVEDMSHELRTPVAVVLTAVQGALRRERAPEQYREALRVVETQARVQAESIGRMLELGRAERQELVVKPVDDLVGAVERLVDELRGEAEERNVELVVSAEAVRAETDLSIFRLVLSNLLHNALDVSPPGSRVEIRVFEDGSGRHVKVRDEGPGIASEDLPYLFERYWRGDRARSRRGGHLGLGLSIAQHAAQLLGARITAESAPGQGATFTVTWPHLGALQK
jgi:signal transduction histidine kinase